MDDSVSSFIILKSKLKVALDRVAKLEARNTELYEAMRIAEDVGVDEGILDEDERMTERLEPPMSTIGKIAVEMAEESE